jgi:RNA polymerase sigma-70 factor (ECF subfamily)
VSQPYVQPDEVRLIGAAARGDRSAQRELFERYRTSAFAVAVRITGKREDALDVVQDAFIKIFDRLDTFNQQSSLKTWVLRIVTNQALDARRRKKVRLTASLDASEPGEKGIDPPAPLESNRPDAGLVQEELSARIRQAMESLPAEQRSVLSLHAAGDMTYGEIAEVLGVPIGTVMSRLYHARRKVQSLLPDLAPHAGSLAKEESS